MTTSDNADRPHRYRRFARAVQAIAAVICLLPRALRFGVPRSHETHRHPPRFAVHSAPYLPLGAAGDSVVLATGRKGLAMLQRGAL